MKLFRSYTFSWKQIGVFKLALITIGMILGAYFSDFVKDNVIVFAAIAILASAYIAIVSLKQIK